MIEIVEMVIVSQQDIVDLAQLTGRNDGVLHFAQRVGPQGIIPFAVEGGVCQEPQPADLEECCGCAEGKSTTDREKSLFFWPLRRRYFVSSITTNKNQNERR